MAGNIEKFRDETEVSTTELAQVLGLTARRVQQMGQDGTITPVKRGKYNLCDAVQSYIKFLSKGASSDDDRFNKTLKTAEVTLKASKARVAKLEADELQGKMHRSEDVSAMTEDLIYFIRNGLMSLPGRLAMNVAAVDTAAEAQTVIQKEVYKLMRELSKYEYDPEKYADRVRERQNWEELPDDD